VSSARPPIAAMPPPPVPLEPALTIAIA